MLVYFGACILQFLYGTERPSSFYSLIGDKTIDWNSFEGCAPPVEQHWVRLCGVPGSTLSKILQTVPCRDCGCVPTGILLKKGDFFLFCDLQR